MSEDFIEARAYGVVDIPRFCKWCFRVFVNQHRSIMIQTAGQPIHVYWSGSVLLVEMDDGQLLRYHDLIESAFQIVYR